jgi:hypothetical protein
MKAYILKQIPGAFDMTSSLSFLPSHTEQRLSQMLTLLPVGYIALWHDADNKSTDNVTWTVLPRLRQLFVRKTGNSGLWHEMDAYCVVATLRMEGKRDLTVVHYRQIIGGQVIKLWFCSLVIAGSTLDPSILFFLFSLVLGAGCRMMLYTRLQSRLLVCFQFDNSLQCNHPALYNMGNIFR